MNPAPVTVAVISYNGRNVVPGCLASIGAQEPKPAEILLGDNASTDGTPDWVREHHPEVRVVSLSSNEGPNPARNACLRAAAHRRVLLVDDDAVLEPGCLRNLLAASERHSEAAVWSPRIVYDDEPGLIQFEGVRIHYVGEAVLLSGDTPRAAGVGEDTPIQVAGGVSYLVDRDKALSIGGFDEAYFFGRTDGEFTFRLTLAGMVLYTVPGAVCRHRVKRRGLSRVYYQVRNRWYLILTTYQVRTFLLIAPALVLYEMFLGAFLALKGKLGDYARGTCAGWRALPSLRRRRASIMATKTARDRDVLHGDRMNIRADLLGNRWAVLAKRMTDAVFTGYWKMVRPLV